MRRLLILMALAVSALLSSKALASAPGCSQALLAQVTPGSTPVVKISGNLNAATPQNSFNGYGSAGSPNGFVPDATVAFTVQDSLGSSYDLLLEFHQIAATPSSPTYWDWSLHEVTGGQLPNSTGWGQGGPGNQIATGSSVYFNWDGSLANNGGGTQYLTVVMALTNGADSPLSVNLDFGTDNGGLLYPDAGIRDGLTGDYCVSGTPTPTPVMNAGGCGQPLVAMVTPGSMPRVMLFGNLDACTAQNPLSGYGQVGDSNGFVPDATASFTVHDSLGTPYEALMAFYQAADTPGFTASWNWSLHILASGEEPNSTSWVPGGPGNHVATGGGITFNPDGSLADNGNGGMDFPIYLALANGAATPFSFQINFGTDNAAAPASTGLRDGLTGDCCSGTPAPSNTPTPVDTATPVDTPTSINTPTAMGSPTPVDTATPINTPTAMGSPTPVDTATSISTPTAMGSPTPVDTATPINTPTAMDSPTPVDTPTALSPSPTPLPLLPGGASALPGSNPSAPSLGSPLNILAANQGPAGAPAPAAKIMSGSGTVVAELSCLTCYGSTLRYAWDGLATGSLAANGLYYFRLDFGPGSAVSLPLYVLR